MYCRVCGTKNPDGAATCTSCGAELVNPHATVNPYATSAANSPVNAPLGPKPPNYLVQSILVTLCCCLPFGIASIVYAAQVDSKWNGGDYAGAMASSDSAKKWCLVALVLGLIANFLIFGLQFIAAIGGVVAP